MKIIKSLPRADGSKIVTVHLAANECLLQVTQDSFYSLGGQVEDTVSSHVLEETARVSWCPVSQQWVDVE